MAEPWATSASGDDGRVRVTVSVYEDIVAPGEFARIRSTYEVIEEGPLRFPQGHHQPLAFLYLRTPEGQTIVYPQRGVSPISFRPLEVADYRRFFLLKKGLGGPAVSYDVPLTDPSPEWLNPGSYETVRPNLRTEGEYEAWVKFTIPEVDGVPDDAWHGTVETKPLRFTVRDIAIADRRAEPTAEQKAHLEAYMQYIVAFRNGEDVDLPVLETEEFPSWLSLDDRVQWALLRTENEGFARYAVEQLREHQPTDEGDEYPKWWANVDFFVGRRAYIDQYQTHTLRIIGPYLDEYAAVAATELERSLAGLESGSSFGGQGQLNMLLDYAELKPDGPIRDRLEKLARQYAKIPTDAKPLDHMTRFRLATAWQTLYGLGILCDGMLFSEATDILGERTLRDGHTVIWNYGTGSRRQEHGVTGKLDIDGDRATIIFTNRDEWLH